MKEIILQGQTEKMRAAVIEEGSLVEVYEEEGQYSRLVGNIYRGRVENVLPGMQAAFVDIGIGKNAFLYVRDILPSQFDEDEISTAPLPKIEQLLKPRQELMVQILKEPVGTKGARVTTNLTIPGRYSVLMPGADYQGVSRKITDQNERARLRELTKNACPPGMGIIVRTLGEGIDETELKEDITELSEVWENIKKSYPHVSIPGLVHKDVDLVARLVRDLIDQDVQKLITDQEEVAQNLRASLQELGHPAAKHVRLVANDDLFCMYGVEEEIRKALRAKVWLKSGGYLIIQQTEALTVIDVNTGKYVGQKSLEDTVLHTNLEAAAEIARQLRLRNIGGIIVIDFIDMVAQTDKNKVLEVLETGCAKDKIKCQILGLTQLGLVEMTRKKVGQTLAVRYSKLCPTCDGNGRIF